MNYRIIHILWLESLYVSYGSVSNMAQIVPTVYTPDEKEDLSSAVITALTEAKGRDVTKEGCVLYDNIEPDALDMMFSDERVDNSVKIEFATHDAIVVIWRDNQISIEIQDLEADTSHR